MSDSEGPVADSHVVDIEHEKPPSPTETAPAEQKPENGKAKSSSRPNAQSRKSMNGPLYMQTSNNKIIIRRARRKGDGPLRNLARWLLDNQTGFSFNLIALLFLTHFCMSKARPYTSKFFTISHYNPETGNYGVGGDDLYFIGFCIVLFTGLRAGLMEHVLAPLAKYWGVAKRKEVTRFSEQAWMLFYYSVFWTLGVYLYCESKYFMNMKELWTDWPTREIALLPKSYFLGQYAFWLQQVIVINIEERRKDHWQMLSHHFVTIALLATSYTFHFTRIGNQILILMDLVDILLPLAKCFKYLGFTTLRDFMFGAFTVGWFVTRHVFYPMTIWSIYADGGVIIPPSCFAGPQGNVTQVPIPEHGFAHWLEPFRDPAGIVCFTTNIRWSFIGALVFLQVLIAFWFVMIINVVIRVLQGAGADDTRSDGEDDEEEEEEYEYEEAQLVEEEVGVEDIDLKGWERRAGVKRAASSSGVSLPGHSDRKELLGRIGCEKQVD